MSREFKDGAWYIAVLEGWPQIVRCNIFSIVSFTVNGSEDEYAEGSFNSIGPEILQSIWEDK